MKSVFISGVSGQDGSILARLLLEKGYEVTGGYRKFSSKLWRLEKLGIRDDIKLYDFETSPPQNFRRHFNSKTFDEIYLLSGFSSTEKSRTFPQIASQKILHEPLSILIGSADMVQKIFVAGSSEIFAATTSETMVNENSVMGPRSPYGFLHLAMKGICESLIETQKAPIFYGILFNHESNLRETHFLIRKILDGFLKIAEGNFQTIKLGNFRSRRDFGLAEDFVIAMHSLMQTSKYGLYNFATGKTHSVLEIALEFTRQFGLTPRFVPEDLKIYDDKSGRILVEFEKVVSRKDDSNSNPGDALKLREITGVDLEADLQTLVSRIITPLWVT